jgi:hypothetical protein
MRFPNTSSCTTLRIITTILNVLMASLFLPLGVGNLINPDVADSYLGLNTRVCLMVILTGVVSIYTLFRPYSGGILLCICAVALCFVSHVRPIRVGPNYVKHLQRVTLHVTPFWGLRSPILTPKWSV